MKYIQSTTSFEDMQEIKRREFLWEADMHILFNKHNVQD